MSSKVKVKVKKFELNEQEQLSFPLTANAHMILKSFPTAEELAAQNLSPEEFFGVFKQNCVYAFAANIALIRVDSSSLVAILGDKVIELAPWFETELLQEKRYTKCKKSYPKYQDEKDGFEDDDDNQDDDQIDEDEDDWDDDSDTNSDGFRAAIASLTEFMLKIKQHMENQDTLILAQDNTIKALYDSVRSLQDSVIKLQSQDKTKH